MSEKSETNAPKKKMKKMKQTSIRDYLSIQSKDSQNCSQFNDNSSDIQMVSTSQSTQIIDRLDENNEQLNETIDCSQMSDFSEIPETPERVVSEDEAMDYDNEKQLLSALNRMPDCLLPLPPLRPDSSHLVLFNVPISRLPNTVPKPFPNSYSDKWNGQHVKMPNSPINQITSMQTIEGQIQRTVTRFSKWELIQNKLLADIKCCEQLEEVIKTYNPFANKYDFDVLHLFFENCSPEESTQFFDEVLPQMIELTLQLPQIVTQSVPLLRQRRNCSLFLSQQQIACLLTNAFFCTFPKRSQTNEEYKNFPIINFLSLFTSFGNEDSLNNKMEKLKCIFNYFRRVLKDVPKGIVSFERRFISREEFPIWHNSNKSLRKLVIMKDGVIETEGKGLLQVDFANKFIGGGVIGSGCVQEEIRFLICPELIVCRLFTEKLLDNEVVIISGCEQFNQYSGYANTFEWMGDHIDDTSHDEWGRRLTRIVAMDALYFSRNEIDIQYETKHFERELNKAFSGFIIRRRSDPKNKCAIASGNWGCGAFNGDPLLKAIIQLMAASQVDRDLVLFTFNDLILKRKIEDFYSFVIENNFCVRHLYRGVLLFNKSRKQFKNISKTDVFDFIQSYKQQILDNRNIFI